jgi:hypothetical protein
MTQAKRHDDEVRVQNLYLALQLHFPEVSALCEGLVCPTPERPCDDVRGLNPLSSESDGDAADFLD